MDWKTCNKDLPRLVRLSAPRAIPRLFRVLTSNIIVSQPVTGLLSSVTSVLLYLSRIDGMAYHEQSFTDLNGLIVALMKHLSRVFILR